MSFAYVLAHPDWRNELNNHRLWRSEARKTALFPFFKKIHYSRITVTAGNSDAVLDFFINNMGMYLLRTIVTGDETDHLFEFGNNQLEVKCSAHNSLTGQTITLACNNSEYLKKNLNTHGIQTSDYSADQYTGLRTFSF